MKDSKNKLLKTAFELFALRGMDGVSTREIVRRAGVNIHAISYYFGGKEGLYKAVIDYLFDFMKEESGSFIHLEEYLRALDGAGREEAWELLFKVIGEFADFGFVPKNKYVALFLTREEFYPSKYGGKFFERLTWPLQDFMTKCISKITGMEENDRKAVLLCHMITAQTLVLGRKRNALLKDFKMKSVDGETSLLIKQMLRVNIKAILKEYIKE